MKIVSPLKQRSADSWPKVRPIDLLLILKFDICQTTTGRVSAKSAVINGRIM